MANYAKGHVRRPNKDQLISDSHRRHQGQLRQLREAVLPSSWDSRAHGWVGPIKDQQQCGSCWDFSGTGIVEIAYNKAGIGGGATIFILSEQYTLSCGKNGGCGGDDNTTVLDWAKATGLPLQSVYGPYRGKPEACRNLPPAALNRIDDWGFADSQGGTGVTPIADIKAAIMGYGAVGCAVAADDAFQNHPAGTVFTGSGSKTIDHDVILIGWNDASKCWILRNSWGPLWCEAGYMRIAYGANLVGTESVWAVKMSKDGK